MKTTIAHMARGFCMGAADVVPGVSGGTMAFILGIYQRLVDAIRSFDLELARLLVRGRCREALARVDVALIAPLGIGITTALMFFTRVVPLPHYVKTAPELVYGLFFGLIVGSIVVLLRSNRIRAAADWVLVAAGSAVGLTIVNLVPVETPEASWFIFLSGALAISAMILPGISGSFILLILRKYAYIFDAIGRLDFSVVIPFAFGCAAGLMAFSRVLSWLLSGWFRQTIFCITGLLVGSLWVIWPFQARTFEVVRGKSRLVSSEPILPAAVDTTLMLSVTLMLVGFAAVLLIDHFATRSRSASA